MVNGLSKMLHPKNPLEPLLVSESAPHQDVPQGQPGTKGSNPGVKNIPHFPASNAEEVIPKQSVLIGSHLWISED